MKRVFDSAKGGTPAKQHCVAKQKKSQEVSCAAQDTQSDSDVCALIENPSISELIQNLEKYERTFNGKSVDCQFGGNTLCASYEPDNFAYWSELAFLQKNLAAIHSEDNRIFLTFCDRRRHCELAKKNPSDAKEVVEKLLGGSFQARGRLDTSDGARRSLDRFAGATEAREIRSCIMNAILLQAYFPRIIVASSIAPVVAFDPSAKFAFEQRKDLALFPSDILTTMLLDTDIHEPKIVILRKLLAKPMQSMRILIQPLNVTMVSSPIMDKRAILRQRKQSLKLILEYASEFMLQYRPEIEESIGLPYIQKIREFTFLCDNYDHKSSKCRVLRNRFAANCKFIETGNMWFSVSRDFQTHFHPDSFSEQRYVSAISYVAKLFDDAELRVRIIISACVLVHEFPRIAIACDWEDTTNFLANRQFVLELIERKKDEEMAEIAHLLAKPLPTVFKIDDPAPSEVLA
ncbi:MAG: hypothetical protein M0R33_13860 [Methylomonas sp.]|jgi:hypothetical protein|uniref:hypothetical protein n=1 Tax=Methylomonas sp. TaxID=418 RepID=UPI0025F4FA2C|nr:hypothetical protein [Methylomonas sp.]MCK9607521.1 hypothetical protein [Methylomonas sp.]